MQSASSLTHINSGSSGKEALAVLPPTLPTAQFAMNQWRAPQERSKTKSDQPLALIDSALISIQ
jgi:hypothetical protein